MSDARESLLFGLAIVALVASAVLYFSDDVAREALHRVLTRMLGGMP